MPLSLKSFRFIPTLGAILIAGSCALSTAHAQSEENGAAEKAAPETAKTLPPVFNGNLCEADSARVCLGVQGHGRDEWVRCMREHYDRLTADCQAVMSSANFKTQVQAPETPAKAAPSLMGR